MYTLFDHINIPLISRGVSFSFEKAGKWLCLKEISVPALVMGGLLGFTHVVLLVRRPSRFIPGHA